MLFFGDGGGGGYVREPREEERGSFHKAPEKVESLGKCCKEVR